MTEATASATERLRRLRDEFAGQLPGKVKQIRDTWEQVQDLEANSEGMKGLALLLHTLGGSAPSFGFKALGAIAQEMEKTIKGLEGDCRLPPAVKSRIGTNMRELTAALGACEGDGAV